MSTRRPRPRCSPTRSRTSVARALSTSRASASDGTLSLLTHYSHKSFGVHTRNMRIIEGRAEGRRHLVVAHQDNDTLAVYALDVVSGLVSGEGPVATASVPSAGNVCVYEF